MRIVVQITVVSTLQQSPKELREIFLLSCLIFITRQHRHAERAILTCHVCLSRCDAVYKGTHLLSKNFDRLPLASL